MKQKPETICIPSPPPPPEPRIATSDEVIGNLNPHVFDRLERIFLCPKDHGSLYQIVKNPRECLLPQNCKQVSHLLIPLATECLHKATLMREDGIWEESEGDSGAMVTGETSNEWIEKGWLSFPFNPSLSLIAITVAAANFAAVVQEEVAALFSDAWSEGDTVMKVTNKWMDGQTDEWTDEWTDGQMG